MQSPCRAFTAVVLLLLVGSPVQAGPQETIESIAGNAPGSNEVKDTLAGCRPPSPPRDLKIVTDGSGYRLTWSGAVDPGSHPIDSYRVYRLDTTSPENTKIPVAVLGAGARSWHESGGPAWTAVYLIASHNACGEGGYSNISWVAAGIPRGDALSKDYPHCIILAIVNPPSSPFVYGPFLECLLPLPVVA